MLGESIKGKSVIVTGGSKGIGKGIARVFARHGARVLVVGRNLAAAEAAAGELTGMGLTASAFSADVTRLASMAKLKVGRLAREITDSCLQYWGGMGYTLDNPVSRAFRDTRLVSIGAGADEIMLGIIAKLEGTLPGTGNRT